MDFFEGKMKFVSDPEQLDRIEARTQEIYDALEKSGFLGSRFVGVKEYQKQYSELHGVNLSRQTVYARVRRGQLESRKEGGTVLVKLN